MQNQLEQLEKDCGIEWREYRLDEVFDNIVQGRRLKKQDQVSGCLPFVMAGVTNTGIVDYIGNEVRVFPKNSLTVDIFGNVFYRSYEYGMGDDTGAYWNADNRIPKFAMLYIATTMQKYMAGKFDFGHKLRSSRSLDFKIKLPTITQNGTFLIAFDFIEQFIAALNAERLAALNAERLAALNAYLTVTKLKDYVLTVEEQAALDGLDTMALGQFNLANLYGKSSRGRRLKSADRIDGDLPFVTAGETDTGISAWIGNAVHKYSKNTVTIDMFGSAKYRDYDYGADDHVAIVHTEKLPKFAVLFLTAAIHKSSHAGQFDYSRNFYASDADELNISLPVKSDKTPDYDYMSLVMSAMQKVVIKNVVDYLDVRIEKTGECIEG